MTRTAPRTSTGLVRVGDRLTGPAAGLVRTVAPRVRRPATRAFKRLAAAPVDLTVLENALGRLAGSATDLTAARPARPAAAQPRPGDGFRARTGRSTTPHRVPAPGVRSGEGGTGSGPPGLDVIPGRGGDEEAPHVATAAIVAGRLPDPPSDPSGNDVTTPTPERRLHDPSPARAAQRRARRPAGATADPPPSGGNGHPTAMAPEPGELSGRSGSRVADLQASGAETVATAGLGGALGDLVRRSTAAAVTAGAEQHPAAGSSGGTATPPATRDGRHPDPVTRHPAPSTPAEVVTAAPATFIAAFEAALDHIVRREAERHGLEGIL